MMLSFHFLFLFSFFSFFLFTLFPPTFILVKRSGATEFLLRFYLIYSSVVSNVMGESGKKFVTVRFQTGARATWRSGGISAASSPLEMRQEAFSRGLCIVNLHFFMLICACLFTEIISHLFHPEHTSGADK